MVGFEGVEQVPRLLVGTRGPWSHIFAQLEERLRQVPQDQFIEIEEVECM